MWSLNQTRARTINHPFNSIDRLSMLNEGGCQTFALDARKPPGHSDCALASYQNNNTGRRAG
jgi:hypothetical protein